MKYTQLLLSLIAVCAISTANAADGDGVHAYKKVNSGVANTSLGTCTMGTTCYFQGQVGGNADQDVDTYGNGTIVYFDAPVVGTYNCVLSTTDSTKYSKASATVYAGGSASFTRTTVSINNAPTPNITVANNGKAKDHGSALQIKFRLLGDVAYPAGVIGVTCTGPLAA